MWVDDLALIENNNAAAAAGSGPGRVLMKLHSQFAPIMQGLSYSHMGSRMKDSSYDFVTTGTGGSSATAAAEGREPLPNRSRSRSRYGTLERMWSRLTC